MARLNRKQRRSIGTVSPATAKRLADVMRKLGSDAMQPAQGVMAQGWVPAVQRATRDQLEKALSVMGGGSAGFDYGPPGKLIITWVCINWLSRYPDPAAIWTNIMAGVSVPKVPTGSVPSKRKVPKAPAPVQSAPTAAPVTGGAAPVAPAAPVAAPITPLDPPDASVDIPVDVPPTMLDVSKLLNKTSPLEKLHPEWDWQEAESVFGVPGLKGRVAVWPRWGTVDAEGNELAHLEVPQIDPDFEWHFDHLQWAVFCAGEVPARGVWLWGNRGTGKTVFSQQFAAFTGRPWYPVTFHEKMEPMDFIGDMAASVVGGEGGSVWRDGTMLVAIKQEIPSVILLDEISQAKAGNITGPLNEIVHPNCSFRVTTTGKRINFSKGHLFVAADNTNGTGDTSNMYEGAKMMNRSTMDRFGYFFRFTYLPKDQEVRVLMSKAHCDKRIASKVWGLLDALRQKVAAGLLSDPPSNREAIAFCAALRAGFDEKDAFEASFVAKYPEEMQEDMRVTFTAAFNPTASQP